MRLRAPEVERRLRKGALRIINASPRLKREYRKHRSPAALVQFAQRSSSLGPLIVYLAGSAFLGTIGGIDAERSEIVFGLVSAVTALAAIGIAMSVVGQLRCSWDLAVLSLLPVEDREIAQCPQHRSIKIGTVLLPILLAFYGSWVLAWELKAGDALIAVSLAGLQFAIIVGLGLVLAGLLHGRIERVGCPVLVVSVLLIPVLAAVDALDLIRIPWKAMSSGANLLLPTGWVHAMMQRGLLGNERASWFLLVPAALLLACIPSAVERTRRSYRVREILPTGEAAPIAVLPPRWYGVELDAEHPWPAISIAGAEGPEHFGIKVDAEVGEVWLQPEVFTDACAEGSFTPNRDALRRYFRASDFLSVWDWKQIGWRCSVERLAGRMLGPRELNIVELLLPSPPKWTGRAVQLVVLAAALGFIPSRLLFGPGAPAAITCILPLAFIAIVATSAAVRDGWVSASGEVAAPIALVPVGHREAVRVATVVGALRGLAILPAAVVAGISSFIGAGLDAWQGALIGLRCAVVFVAMHQWSYWVFTKRRTSVQTGFAPLLRQGVYGPLMVSFALSAFLFVLPEVGEPWNTVAAGVMFGSGYLASRFDEWRFNRGRYDLTARPADG